MEAERRSGTWGAVGVLMRATAWNNGGSLRVPGWPPLAPPKWCWGIGRLAGKTLPETDGAIASVSVAAPKRRSRFELRVHAGTRVDTSPDAALAYVEPLWGRDGALVLYYFVGAIGTIVA
jgi:hypothetical protein